MIYATAAMALLVGADAFQAGMMPARSSVARSASAAMQVAEAEVASPVALAKVCSQAFFERALCGGSTCQEKTAAAPSSV